MTTTIKTPGLSLPFHISDHTSQDCQMSEIRNLKNFTKNLTASACKPDTSVILDQGGWSSRPGSLSHAQWQTAAQRNTELRVSHRFPHQPPEERFSRLPRRKPHKPRGVHCQGPCRCTRLAVSTNSAFLLLKASFLIRVLSVWKTRPMPDTQVSSEDVDPSR